MPLINQINPNEERIFTLRLDPGELGLVRQLTKKQLTMAITQQERANLYGFMREAIAEGKEILYYTISLRPGLINGTPAITAGKTEVWFVTPKSGGIDLRA